jgi:hypothetical protein
MSQAARTKSDKKPAATRPPEPDIEDDDENLAIEWTDLVSAPTFKSIGKFSIGRADPYAMYGEMYQWKEYPADLRNLNRLSRNILAARAHVFRARSQWQEDTDVAVLRQEVEDLRARMARLEVILEGADQPSFRDPDLAWCEEHLDVLKNYPDSYVAIDTAAGKILAHAREEIKFIEQLKALDASKRKALFTTHTSTYLIPDAN